MDIDSLISGYVDQIASKVVPASGDQFHVHATAAQRRRRRQGAALIVVLPVVAGGFVASSFFAPARVPPGHGAAASSSDDSQFALPAFPAEMGGDQALLVGRLQFERNCPQVVRGDGTTVAVSFLNGLVRGDRSNPGGTGIVEQATSKVVAHEGDIVRFGGGYGRTVDFPNSECATANLGHFLVSELSTSR